MTAPLTTHGLYLVGAGLGREPEANPTPRPMTAHSPGEGPRALLALLTDLVLTVARDDTALYARVLSTFDGLPVEGARVRLMKPGEREGAGLGRAPPRPPRGATVWSASRSRGQVSLSLVAQHGGDVAVATLRPYFWNSQPERPALQGNLALDRTRAAPGERVAWRARVRQRGPQGLVPASGAAISIVVRDGDKKVLADHDATLGELGTATGTLALPVAEPTGGRSGGSSSQRWLERQPPNRSTPTR